METVKTRTLRRANASKSINVLKTDFDYAESFRESFAATAGAAEAAFSTVIDGRRKIAVMLTPNRATGTYGIVPAHGRSHMKIRHYEKFCYCIANAR